METPSKPQAVVKSDFSAKLYNALQKIQTVLVKEAGEGIKSNNIFLNSTMKQISERIPRTLEELRDIDRIGDGKLNKYGARVLETIETTILENTEAFENYSNSICRSDSVKRKRDQVEGDEVLIKSSQTSGRQSSNMETPSKKQAVESEFATILYTALQKLRTVLVKEAGEGVIAYHIFPNATMKQMCERIPRTLEELRDIHGIGSVKLNKYGARVLEAIEATILENAEAYKNNSSSNGNLDSAQGRREEAEGDVDLVKSSKTFGIPSSKMETPSKSQAIVESGFSSTLYTALKKLRTVLLKEAGEGVMAYHIFPNSTLKLMCDRIPRKLEELRGIHGIGNAKLNKYGVRVLETIEATILENTEAFENHFSSICRSDSVKRKRDQVEGDEVVIKSSQTSGSQSSDMETPSKPQAVVESEFVAKLYTALQKLRRVLVKEAGEGVMAYHIFPNATMKQMCEKIPRTLEQIRDIHGIGSVKLNKYGAKVLETIEATILENAEAYKNNSSSTGNLDSAQGRREEAEGDVDLVKSSQTFGIPSSKTETPSKSQAIVESGFSSTLYTALKKLRTVLLKEAEEGVMAYHIFPNSTLKLMCDRIPRTLEELRGIHGIGNAMLNKYGARVLETIEATILENTEVFENHSSSICRSDSVKRKRDQVEGDEVVIKSSQTSGSQSSDMATPSKPLAVIESEFAAILYTALQKLRTVLVKDAGEGVKAYQIFPNATMKQMCEKVPRTLEELRDIHGIGSVKLNKYGATVLETIEATISGNAKIYKNNSSSTGNSDSAHGRREEAEGEVDLVESSQTSGRPSSKMETPSKSQAIVESGFSSTLYTALKKLRIVLLKEAGEGVKAYHIFPNSTLKIMCDRVPRTLEELRGIHGIGNVKMDKYGARVLETIETTIKENAEAYEHKAESDEVLVESSHTSGRPTPKMENPLKAEAIAESDFSDKLYNALRKLRTVLVEEAGEGVLAFHIFTNAALKQICEKIPRTLKQLLDIHGIGNRKVNKYGARVLETIEATIKENAEAYKNNSSTNSSSDSVKRKRDGAECDDDIVKST